MHLTAGEIELPRGSFYNCHNKWDGWSFGTKRIGMEKEKKDGNLFIYHFGRFGDRTLHHRAEKATRGKAKT
jgi:hypothetical protein